MFLFNCGGWQTEGWTGETKLGNICGYLGSLEFELADGEGILRRENLNISGDHYPKAWTIRAKVSQKTNVQIDALLLDGTKLPMASTLIEAGNQKPITIACSPLNQTASSLVGLELQLRAHPKTRVEIDSLVAD